MRTSEKAMGFGCDKETNDRASEAHERTGGGIETAFDGKRADPNGTP